MFDMIHELGLCTAITVYVLIKWRTAKTFRHVGTQTKTRSVHRESQTDTVDFMEIDDDYFEDLDSDLANWLVAGGIRLTDSSVGDADSSV